MTLRVLAALTADMKAQRPDHIAVTGDIANIALPQEYLRGRDFLESLGSAHDVTFVPGNHDIYVPEAAALAARHWEPWMCDDDGKSGFPFVRRRGPVALIGVNSGVPTAPFLATGWVGPKQLTELAALLKTLKEENLFRVVMIHHPPVSKAGRHKRLLDADVFKRVIAEAWRRTDPARARSSAHDQLARRSRWRARAGGRRAVGFGQTGHGPRQRGVSSLSN